MEDSKFLHCLEIRSHGKLQNSFDESHCERRNQKQLLCTCNVQQQHIAVPRRFSTFAREVWQMQPRLIQRQPRNVLRLLGHKRFRAAFDFLCLRGSEDEALNECAQWWQTLQEIGPEERQTMIDELPINGGQRRRRRRKRPADRAQSDSADA